MRRKHYKRTAVARLLFDDTVRDKPPEDHYATIARFKGYPPQYTLMADFFNWKNNGWDVLAMVNFLVEEAPHALLKRGTYFELLEGRIITARGRILTSSCCISQGE